MIGGIVSEDRLAGAYNPRCYDNHLDAFRRYFTR